MRQRIAFICVENSCRSQIAEAFARIHGGGRVEAFSAGSAPSGKVNPTAIRVMGELGYDLSTHRSGSVDRLPHGEMDAIVSMGCGDACPTVPTDRRIEWDIPDPKHLPLEEFRAIRDQIETRVKQILSELLEEEP
jgi:protein-tyrosine-phosphatase